MDHITSYAIGLLIWVIFYLAIASLCIYAMPATLKLNIHNSFLFRDLSTKTKFSLLMLASVLTIITGLIPSSAGAERQTLGVLFNVMTVDSPINGSGRIVQLKGIGIILNFVTYYLLLSLALLGGSEIIEGHKQD